MSLRWAALLVALLVGCGGTEETPESRGDGRGQAIGGPGENEPRLPTDWKHVWEDIDRNDRGEPYPEQVARWVTERRNFVEKCLRNEPTPAVTQAREVLEEILSKVPDSSKDRFLLGQCLFAEARYWWGWADITAWEMARVQLDKTEPETKGGAPMTDEQVKQRVAALKRELDRLLVELDGVAPRALQTFTSYRAQRPDDKRVLDYIWKLHFFLQNYPEARRWLDIVLQEMEAAGVPEREPLRQEYTLLREEIDEQLADRKLNGQRFQPVRPQNRDRFRSSRRPGD
jgi:hypothetical protein